MAGVQISLPGKPRYSTHAVIAPKFRRKPGINGKSEVRSAKSWGSQKDKVRMNGAVRVLAVFAILSVAAVGGLVYLGQSVQPTTQTVEKVLPDGQFPR